jgi:DNA-binding transcriptional LysR family regulator
MISSYVLPILYGEFFKKYPEMKVNIIEDDRSGLINMFEDNRINMAFLPHEGVWDHKLNSEMMVELDSVCCMPKDHPLAKRRSVSVKDLENEDLILFKNSFFQTERILKRFRQNDVEPNVIFNTAQVSTIQSIVSNGLAVSFIFKFLLESTPKLIGVPLEPPMRTKVSLVWKQGEYLSGDMLRLIKFVKNYYEKTQSHRGQ